MATKLSVYCDKVVEAGWLMAVVLIPLFFNVYSSRVFEPDKLTLLRSIALIMIVAWLIKVLEQVTSSAGGENQSTGEASGQGAFRRWLVSTPLVLPTLAMALVYIISTAASVVPWVSLLGSYQRLQGTYTTFSYLIVFFMMLQGMRQREQLDRLVTAVLLTSASISLYGIIQHDKLDPLPWGGDVVSRVSANMGNPIFVSAYLIMALPLTLGRLIETLGRVVDSNRPGRTVLFVTAYVVLLIAQMLIWILFGFMAGLFSGLGLILVVVLAFLFLDRPVVHFALLGAYSFIFAVQTVAILFSQSRGPWVGLLAGLYLFGLLVLTSLRRWIGEQGVPSGRQTGQAARTAGVSPLLEALRRAARWLWLAWLVMALVGVLFLVTLSVPKSPLSPLRSVPYIGRLGDVFERSGSGLVRMLIWEGAVDLVKPHAPLEYSPGQPDSLNFLRPVIGYGPESMYVAYNRFYPPDLAHVEARNASPDRAHNETFDALVITGLLGFLAYLAVFGSVFYYGLRCLGMAGGRRERYVYIGLWVGGGLLGAIVSYLLDGTLRFFGVGLPTGCIIGLALYVALYDLLFYDPQAGEGTVGGSRLMVIALLAAMVAHFVEIHFGIAIAASRTHFWVYAGAMVAAGYYFRQQAAAATAVPAPAPAIAVEPVVKKPAESNPRRQPRRSPRGNFPARQGSSDGSTGQTVASRPGSSRTTSGLSVYALLVGLILITMIYNFVTRNFDLRAGQYSIFWLFTVTWVLSSIIVLALSAEGSQTQEKIGDWVRGLITYLMISLGCSVVFLVIYRQVSTVDVTKKELMEVMMQIAGQINTLLLVFYIAVAGLLLLTALALYRTVSSLPGNSWQYRNWWIYPPLVVAVIYVVMVTNIQVVMADMVYKQALPYDDRREYDASIVLYRLAVQLAPTQDFYFLFLGRAYLEKAQRTDDPQQRATLLAASRDALLKALDINPLNTDHSANLGRLYRAWGGLITTPTERTQLLEQSYTYYRQATSLSPHNAQLWNEEGLVCYFLGRYSEAVEKYQESVKLDPVFVDTYVFLGDAYQALNKPDEALQAHLKAVSLNSGSLTDQRLFSLPIPGFQERRFDFYSKAGNIDKLIQALESLPRESQDFSTNYTLGNILLKQGTLDKALERFKRAADLSPNDLGTRIALGYIYAQQGKLEESLAEFQRCIQISPNDLVSHRNLGGVLRQMNRLDEARQAFEKAASLSPNDLLTIQNLADVYRMLGRKQDAAGQMKRWVELAPNDFNAHKNLSLIYRDLGQITEAITQALQSIELAPEDQKPALQQYLTQLEGQKGSP